MNRRQFVLSWGRKLIFGLAWPIFSAIGLIYLQSFVLPQTPLEATYFALSFVGLYGFLCSVLYFIFYCPVVLIFPTYYFSRIWSLCLILLMGSMIFFDAYVFSQFRLHLNFFFLNLIYQKGITAFISNKAVFILFAVALSVASVVIWFRGNMTWRQMQKRFSNPVANWYLAVIFVCFGSSHLIRIYASASMERMQSLFPAQIALSGSLAFAPVKEIGRLYYPKGEMKCTGKGHPNIVFLVIKGLKYDSLKNEFNPNLSHLQTHGSIYRSHYSGSTDTMGGLFSLFYSLPSTYANAFRREKKSSVFLEELKKRKYQLISFTQNPAISADPLFSEFTAQEIVNGSLTESWKSWVDGGTATPPLFAFFSFDLNQSADQGTTDMARVDREIRSLVLSMHYENVLKDTTIVITGDHGPDSGVEGITEDKLKTPFMIVWPHRAQKEFTHFTSHYDVVPTMMRELWNCKSNFSGFSVGKSLNDGPLHPWHLIEVDKNFALMDLEKSNFTRITDNGGFEVRDFMAQELPASKGRTDLTLKALKDNYRFYKR